MRPVVESTVTHGNHCARSAPGRLLILIGELNVKQDDYLKDIAPKGAPRLPSTTFVLDRPGLGRIVSLPASSTLKGGSEVRSRQLSLQKN